MSKILSFPHDYVIIDIEMTGLEPEKDSIIEIAGLRIINNIIKSTFSSLIKPEEYTLKEEITKLTGITEEMLSSAPHFPEIEKELFSFIGTLPLLGHNILLDIQFLNKTMKEHGYKTFRNDYVDTLPLSQKLFPEFIHHKLTDMALYYEISTQGAHRALQDCYITKECFDKMYETMNRSFPSKECFAESFSTTGRRLKAEQVQAFKPKFDLNILPHPILQHNLINNRHYTANVSIPNKNVTNIQKKTFVFTGILTKMSRREAMIWVSNFGGINEDKLTTKTDYLVVGWKEEEIIRKDNLSTKEKKALRYQAEGFPIHILTEDEFYKLIIEEIIL